MRRHHYPSDLTDDQWALIEPHLPPDPGGGRPRKTDMRDVARRHLLSSSAPAASGVICPATSRPRAPPGGTSTAGVATAPWTAIHDRLRRKVRAAEKPYHPRTTASVDSQSVDTTSGGEARGRDNAKNVNGRKRHIVVDSMGLLLAVLVTAAVDRRRGGGPELFARLEGQPMSKVVRMYRRQQVSQLRALRVGRDQRGVGSGDRPPAERCRRAG